MYTQRILREAQKIASKFSFWMVSGNIAHLYGHVYETPNNKYDLEIKFNENFPNTKPLFLYHKNIKELLGDIQLNSLNNWTPNSAVVDIVNELKLKIQNALKESVIIEEKQPTSINSTLEVEDYIKNSQEEVINSEEYITPDLDAYPPNFEVETLQPQLDSDINSSDSNYHQESINNNSDFQENIQEKIIEESSETLDVGTNTELSLIQQYYAYDQKGTSQADINVYMTITLSKTFIIGINFLDFPNRPIFSFPEEIIKILGDPYKSLDSLKKWNHKKPPHIIDTLQELESKLLFIKDIELQSKKIIGEYKTELVDDSVIQLRINLMTYGFKEYNLSVNLGPYPKPPEISLSAELQNIIANPIKDLISYKKWRENESEPVEIIREIAWLVDKHSRISFEMDLLKKDYKNIKFDSLTDIIYMEMQGKMKTQDLIFKFQINLPKEYPMTIPEIKLLNEFELESHEKIKDDLQSSFKDFFKKWTPFSYLVDLFNLISEKIFEISATSCVICHNLECPTCSMKIAGPESCHASCPHCDRSYHKHCWEQTLNQFGKCGFCLRVA